jgi:hypothetical protein
MFKRDICGPVCFLCMGAVLVMEAAHLSHAAVCVEPPSGPDLGPSEGCNEPGQPHSRNVSINTLTTANSTSTTTYVVAASPVVFDADDVRLDQQPPFTTEQPGSAPRGAPFFDPALVRWMIERSG